MGRSAAERYERALASVAKILIESQVKDLKHRHRQGQLDDEQYRRLAGDLRIHGPVITWPVIEAMGLRFTADARDRMAHRHHGQGEFDE